MSTRSFIGRYDAEAGHIEFVYCHMNGKPMWNGRTLNEHWTEPNDVRQLIAGGDMSVLGHDLRNCSFYGDSASVADGVPVQSDNVKNALEDFESGCGSQAKSESAIPATTNPTSPVSIPLSIPVNRPRAWTWRSTAPTWPSSWPRRAVRPIGCVSRSTMTRKARATRRLGCGRSATSPLYQPTQADPDPHHEHPESYCSVCGYFIEHADECPNCGEPC